VSLSFEADLQITGPTSNVEVTNDDTGALIVTTDKLRPLVATLRSDGLLPSGTLRTMSDLLAGAGGTIHLRTQSTDLVTLGSGAVPTVVTRVVGLRHVRIESLRGVVVALLPSPRLPFRGGSRSRG
jgi:hypothetical protein